MSRDHARREVRRAVEATGTIEAFAKKAKVDPGTLGDFLAGKRWAQAPTRTKIEKALRWPAGRITDLAEGALPDGIVDVSATPGVQLLIAAVEGLSEDDLRVLRQMAERLSRP